MIRFILAATSLWSPEFRQCVVFVAGVALGVLLCVGRMTVY